MKQGIASKKQDGGVMIGALDGLKVADFTRFVAGPFCSMQLADHGADVIKIESPINRGDQLRSWGPFDGDHRSSRNAEARL